MTVKVVSIRDGFEQAFWDSVNHDPLNYYFFILDWKERPEQTRIYLARDGERVVGMMLVFSDRIVQLRGSRRAVEKLLDFVDLEKVELQAPLDCENLVDRKYEASIRHELVLMTLHRGEEKLQITEKHVRLGPSDAEEVTSLMRMADPEWWTDVTVEERRESLTKTHWLGIRQKGRIVAVGNTRFVDLGSNISVMATLEGFRNLGFATSIVSALVEEIFKRSSTALIHVLSHNMPAVRAYSKVGFKPYRCYLLMRAIRIKT